MAGTDQGPCEMRACRLPFMHRGAHDIRRCAHTIDNGDTLGHCRNPTRNVEERYCIRHESRETYERYTDPRDGSVRRG